MKTIAKVLLNSLYFSKDIKSNPKSIKISTSKLKNGSVSCTILCNDKRERQVFLNSLSELLGPLQDSRYIIKHKNTKSLFSRYSYKNVPSLLGKNKNFAQYFENEWNKKISKCELVYTKTMEGRKELIHAINSGLGNSNIQRVKIWK